MKLSKEEKEFIYSLFDREYTVNSIEKWLDSANQEGDHASEPLRAAAVNGYIRAVRACMEKERRRKAAVVSGLIADQAECMQARGMLAARLEKYLEEISYEETCVGIYGCTRGEAELLSCIIAYLKSG